MSLLQLEGGVTSLNPEDFDSSVRPSVTRVALNEHIRDTGLFFSVGRHGFYDRNPDQILARMHQFAEWLQQEQVERTLSDMVGIFTGTLQFSGTIKQNVLNLEIVLADGTIVHTRGRGRRPR